ncbi:MAG TPA: anthranilate synthase component I, partial [Dehalococcoidia bacterium]|nr:anthranilate synthase component I [Dehalococcoidia bacterium]
PYANPKDGSDPLIEIEAELSRYRLSHPKDTEARSSLPRFTGGAVGFLAYDVVRHFEPRVQIPAPDPQNLPEALFMFVDTLLVFDHLKHVIKVVSHCRLDGDVEQSYRQACWRIDELVTRLGQSLPAAPYRMIAPEFNGETARSNVGTERYIEAVETAKKYIVAGDIIQMVPSQRLFRRTSAHPFSIYRALRMVNPSPYMYYLQMGDSHIVGASPEMLVRVEDGVVETHPIAGTLPRGRTPDEDEAIEQQLLHDEKERAEHVMLVDLGRNDIGRVSQPGTVAVKDFMIVERYSHVMHLVSRVEGKLKPEMSAYDALRACFPAGTLAGAPKIRAMEIISEMETDRRGPYGGAVGYFDFSGNMDTAITIRTMVMKDGVAHVQAGGGVVYDSVPEREYQETLNKARAVMTAIDRAETLEEGLVTAGSLGY